MQLTPHSIRVYKQYFNFASGHFLIFGDGSREPLHGHNYRVEVELFAEELFEDLVFDFLDFKPIVRKICDSLDHRLLLPRQNPNVRFYERGKNLIIQIEGPQGEEEFSIPQTDIIFLPLPNTSVERLAIYLADEIKKELGQKYTHSFHSLVVQVEETPGQCALHRSFFASK